MNEGTRENSSSGRDSEHVPLVFKQIQAFSKSQRTRVVDFVAVRSSEFNKLDFRGVIHREGLPNRLTVDLLFLDREPRTWAVTLNDEHQAVLRFVGRYPS